MNVAALVMTVECPRARRARCLYDARQLFDRLVDYVWGHQLSENHPGSFV